MKKTLLVAALVTCPLFADDLPNQENIQEVEKSELIAQETQEADDFIKDAEDVPEIFAQDKNEKLAELLDALTEEENKLVEEFVRQCMTETKEVTFRVFQESSEIKEVTDKWEQNAKEHEVLSRIKQELRDAGHDDSLTLPSLTLTQSV